MISHCSWPHTNSCAPRKKSGRGQPHSKTWRDGDALETPRQRFGVRLSSAAFIDGEYLSQRGRASFSSFHSCFRTLSALPVVTFLLIAAAGSSSLTNASAADASKAEGFKPLFNGTNLDGWYIVLRNGKSTDPDHLVQIHDGAVHMYKDAPEASPQPHGYIVTEKEYSNYHLLLEYKWGTKRFGQRAKARRDAGVLYHAVGKDGVWPRSVECQIQENDVGDIFTVNTRVTASVDPHTTNMISNVTTNDAGVVRTNQTMQPKYLPRDQGAVQVVQGISGGIRRVIRNPMIEHDGWNTVEVVVRGDSSIHIVNGVTNNQTTAIQEMVNNQWVPLKKGKITLQLESSEVLYRNIQVKELSD